MGHLLEPYCPLTERSWTLADKTIHVIITIRISETIRILVVNNISI